LVFLGFICTGLAIRLWRRPANGDSSRQRGQI
jgi:hypothetical protein